MFLEINDLHRTLSDLAKNLSTLPVIFFYSSKNKCSMASGSRWDDCEEVEGIQMGSSERLFPLPSCLSLRHVLITKHLSPLLYSRGLFWVHGYLSWEVIWESQGILKGAKKWITSREIHICFSVFLSRSFLSASDTPQQARYLPHTCPVLNRIEVLTFVPCIANRLKRSPTLTATWLAVLSVSNIVSWCYISAHRLTSIKWLDGF